MEKISPLPREVVLLRRMTVAINLMSDFLSDEKKIQFDVNYLLEAYCLLVKESWLSSRKILESRNKNFEEMTWNNIQRISREAYSARRRYEGVVSKVRNYEFEFSCIGTNQELVNLQRTIITSGQYLYVISKLNLDVKILLLEFNKVLSSRLKNCIKLLSEGDRDAYFSQIVSARQLMTDLNKVAIIRSI